MGHSRYMPVQGSTLRLIENGCDLRLKQIILQFDAVVRWQVEIVPYSILINFFTRISLEEEDLYVIENDILLN